MPRRKTTIQRSARYAIWRTQRSRSSGSNLCARIATVDRETNVPLSELSMLDDAVSASSTWFVGVNPDSDAAHVCSHELVKKLVRDPAKGVGRWPWWSQMMKDQ
jgi:hypothetical protein